MGPLHRANQSNKMSLDWMFYFVFILFLCHHNLDFDSSRRKLIERLNLNTLWIMNEVNIVDRLLWSRQIEKSNGWKSKWKKRKTKKKSEQKKKRRNIRTGDARANTKPLEAHNHPKSNAEIAPEHIVEPNDWINIKIRRGKTETKIMSCGKIWRWIQSSMFCYSLLWIINQPCAELLSEWPRAPYTLLCFSKEMKGDKDS